jgi:hypothetical protein
MRPIRKSLCVGIFKNYIGNFAPKTVELAEQAPYNWDVPRGGFYGWGL